jgi:hypothetical protein
MNLGNVSESRISAGNEFHTKVYTGAALTLFEWGGGCE